MQPVWRTVVRPGSSITYAGKKIERNAEGQIGVDGNWDSVCVEFRLCGGVGNERRGVALLKECDQVEVYAGNFFGEGMITREMVITQ
jgi:hypothetical protein